VNPTYHNLGDHAESIQIDFDPSRIGYAKLLDIFWASHDPGTRPWSPQYRAAIFFQGEEQRREAIRTRDREAQKFHGKVYTEIVPAGPFHVAEGYHQKYALRGDSKLATEIAALYPKEEDLVRSTAAARINGYLAGYGDLRQLKDELTSFGLSEKGSRHLWEIVRKNDARRGNGDSPGIACPVPGPSGS
jgi:peptide-methionine (S)-S-oxide reductase